MPRFFRRQKSRGKVTQIRLFWFLHGRWNEKAREGEKRREGEGVVEWFIFGGRRELGALEVRAVKADYECEVRLLWEGWGGGR
eukprot:3375209-Rhodomonas_salina.1